MALRARRPGTQATETNTTVSTPAVENTAPQQTAVQGDETVAQQQENTHVPAQRQTSAPAVATGNQIADLNAGILENVEDLTGGGNYVTVDGTEFLYKDSNETAPEIEIVVSGGKRFYQWVDETDPENKQYHNSDTKLDNRYKLKFELRWFEETEEGDATEYIMSLSTTSAIQFISYVQALAKQGKGVGQVVTKMTISRQTSKDGKNRFSRVEFENVGDAELA